MEMKISANWTIQQLYNHRVVIVGILFIQLIVDRLYSVATLPVTFSSFITILIVYVMVRKTDETYLAVEKRNYMSNRVKNIWSVFTLTTLSCLRIALNSILREETCQHDINNMTCTGALLSLFMSYVVMMLSFSDNWLMLCFFNQQEPVVVHHRRPYNEPAAGA